MADRGIKEIRKPRRTKGTVAGIYRNYFGLGVLTVGVLCGLLYHFSLPGRLVRDIVASGRFNYSEEFIDRRATMEPILGQRASTIQKRLENSEYGE